MNNKRLEQIKQKLSDDIPTDIETAESVVLELVEEVERLKAEKKILIDACESGLTALYSAAKTTNKTHYPLTEKVIESALRATGGGDE